MDKYYLLVSNFGQLQVVGGEEKEELVSFQ